MQTSKSQYGSVPIESNTNSQGWDKLYEGYFKILFLKKGSRVKIDFEDYICEESAFFFFNEEHSFEMQDNCFGQN